MLFPRWHLWLGLTCPFLRTTRKQSLFIFCLPSFGGVSNGGRHALENPERVPVRVEQHLVGLEQIRPDQKRTAVRQLNVSHLQLDAIAADTGPVLTPEETVQASGRHALPQVPNARDPSKAP